MTANCKTDICLANIYCNEGFNVINSLNALSSVWLYNRVWIELCRHWLYGLFGEIILFHLTLSNRFQLKVSKTKQSKKFSRTAFFMIKMQ